MKLELIGDVYNKDPFKGTCVTWALWLDENYEIASGRAPTKKLAEQHARKAFRRFQRAVARKKSIRFQEWA